MANSRNQSVEYFLTLLALEKANPENNKSLQNTASTANLLLKDLGMHERDYKPSVQNVLHELNKHFCSISSLTTCTTSGGLEIPLVNVPHLLPSSSPMGYSIQVGKSVIDGITQKELLKVQMESAVSEVKSKNLELKKVKEEAETLLNNERRNAERKTGLLLPENAETLAYTHEVYKQKLADLKKIKEPKSESAHEKMVKIKEFLNNFQSLKTENKKLKTKLSDVAENGKLPPKIAEVQVIVAERKEYLEALCQQINTFDETGGSGSVFNS